MTGCPLVAASSSARSQRRKPVIGTFVEPASETMTVTSSQDAKAPSEAQLKALGPDGLRGRAVAQLQLKAVVVAVRQRPQGLARKPMLGQRPALVELRKANRHTAAHRGITPEHRFVAEEQALATIGRERRVGLVVPSFLMVPPLIDGSDLIAMLPSRCLPEAAMDRFVALEPLIAVEGFPLHLAWHARRDADGAVQHVVGIIRALLGENRAAKASFPA